MTSPSLLSTTPRSTAPAPGSARRLARTLRPSNLIDFIFGYDVFISYARRDGQSYVIELSNELGKLGYRCFVDVSELPPGDQLGPALRRALRKSSALLVVGSAGALESRYMPQEISTFVELRPDAPIVPISIGNTLDSADPATALRVSLGDRVWITEEPAALADAPGDRVRTELLRAFSFTRRDTWRLRITSAVALVMVILVLVAFGLLVVAQRARLAAERQVRISEVQRLAAQSAQALDDFPQRSLLLAVEAALQTQEESSIAQIPWAEQTLRSALQATGGTALGAPDYSPTWGKIKRVALSPDGHWALAIRQNDGAPLWDLTARDPSATAVLVGDAQNEVGAGVFTRDSRALVVGQRNTIVRYSLGPELGAPTALGTVNDSISGLTISANGRWVTACTGSFATGCKDLSIVDLAAKSPRAKVLVEGEVAAAVFTPDDRWLLTGGTDQKVRFWDLTGGDGVLHERVVEGFSADIATLAVSEDGKWLVVGGGREVGVWPIGEHGVDGQPRILTCLSCPLITRVAVSGNGRWIAAAGVIETEIPVWQSFLSDWDRADLDIDAYLLRGHAIGLNDLALSADGRWLATAGRDKTARLWDLEALHLGEKVATLAGHEDEVTSVVFSKDGGWILTGSDDLTAHLWPVGDGHVAAIPRTIEPRMSEQVNFATLNADRSLLTVNTGEGVEFWDLRSGESATSPKTLRTDVWGTSQAVSADRKWLVLTGAAGGADSLLWNLGANPPEPKVLRGHDSQATTSLTTPDNRWAVTAGDDKTARLWDLEKSDPAATSIVLAKHADIIRAVAVDRSARWLVTASRDGTARRWDLADPHPDHSAVIVADHGNRPGSGLTSVAVSFDARRVVTGDYDGIVKVWNLERPSSSPLLVLRGHKQAISGLAMPSDGGSVLSCSEDGTIRIWNLKTEKPSAAPVVMRAVGACYSLELERDERWIVTRDDRTVRLWIRDPRELIPMAHTVAGRNFTPLEWDQYFPERSYREVFEDLPVRSDD
jgi:WD40 repeat protein